jgi:hypothetical protein
VLTLTLLLKSLTDVHLQSGEGSSPTSNPVADGRAPMDGRDQSKESKHVRLPQAGLGLEGLDDAIPPFLKISWDFGVVGHKLPVSTRR